LIGKDLSIKVWLPARDRGSHFLGISRIRGCGRECAIDFCLEVVWIEWFAGFGEGILLHRLGVGNGNGLNGDSRDKGGMRGAQMHLQGQTLNTEILALPE
jgi:hypothetical protein